MKTKQSNKINSPMQMGTLIIANLLTIFFFVSQGGSIMQALWIYWFQSVIIGVVNVARIITVPADNYPLSVNGRPLTGSQLGAGAAAVLRTFAALAFTFHYGIFHMVYFMFLSAGELFVNTDTTAISVSAILLSSAVFALHHVMSFLAERQLIRKRSARVASSDIMSRPYARILPMHLIIIVGPLIVTTFGANGVFILFMILKTYSDVRLHLKGTSHPLIRKA